MRHLSRRSVGGPFGSNVAPESGRSPELDAVAPAPGFFSAPAYGMWTAADLPEAKVDGPWLPQAWQAAWRYELASALIRWFREEAARRGLCAPDGRCDLLELPGLGWLRPPADGYPVAPGQQEAWLRLLRDAVWEGPRDRAVDSFLLTPRNPWFAAAFPGLPDWRRMPDTPQTADFLARTGRVLKWLQSDAGQRELQSVWALPRLQPAQWMLRFLRGAWTLRAEAVRQLTGAEVSADAIEELVQRQQEAQLLTTFRPTRPWAGMTPASYLLENHGRLRMQSGQDVPLWRLPGLERLEPPAEGPAWRGARSFAARKPFLLLTALDDVRTSYAAGGGPLGGLVALYREFLAPAADPVYRTYRAALGEQPPDQVLALLQSEGAAEVTRTLPYLAGVTRWPDPKLELDLRGVLRAGGGADIDPAAFWVWGVQSGSCAPMDIACLAEELIRRTAGAEALARTRREVPEAFRDFAPQSQQIRAGDLRLQVARSTHEQLRLRVAADAEEAAGKRIALAAAEQERLEAARHERQAAALLAKGSGSEVPWGFAAALVAVVGALVLWPR